MYEYTYTHIYIYTYKLTYASKGECVAVGTHLAAHRTEV